ncbi:MAG TPA: YebC/PmpR family DNA-binding transcriptional regulator [Candidatus Polarisedimenticolaceae bacterium]|nr:YebC/PmpR family DNA-binding transcriptional regulator [Candidatus Polarisedimenticolaceae bacterium]
MSGHSKWHSIKHQKGIADARRGAVFTKLANAIALATKKGGADPEMNFSLRLAIQKAKAANMPASNIERSIKRGSGQLGGDQIEEITYEGYGPGGAALIIETATDNRNRTGPEVRTALSKSGGRLADAGSVVYQFDQRGVIRFKPDDLEAATLDAIEAGADDVDAEGDELVVYTIANQLNAVQTKLTQMGYTVSSSELAYIAKNTIMIEDEKVAGQLLRLMDTLEDMDDVSATHANFDFSQELAESLST